MNTHLGPLLHTQRLTLALPQANQADAYCRYFNTNRTHLARWSPPLAAGMDQAAYWAQVIATSHADYEADRSLRLVMTPREAPDRIIGTVGFSAFVRGAFQACYLGYGIAADYEGKGLMHEALVASIEYVFSQLSLHRVMANYMPTNERSGRLLRRLGFVPEGYARDYLYIDGAWRDHILTSLTHTALVAPGRP